MVAKGITPMHYGLMVRPHYGDVDKFVNIMFAPSMFAFARLGLYSKQTIMQKLAAVVKELRAGNHSDLEYLTGFFHEAVKRDKGDRRQDKEADSITFSDLEVLVNPGAFKPWGEKTKAEKMASNKMLRREAFMKGELGKQHPSVSVFDTYSSTVWGRSNGVLRDVQSYLDVTLLFPFIHLGESGVAAIDDGLRIGCHCKHATKNRNKDGTVPVRDMQIACYHIAVSLTELHDELSGKSERKIRKLSQRHVSGGERIMSVMPYDFSERFELVLDALVRRYGHKQNYYEIDRALMDHEDSIVTPGFKRFMKEGDATREVVKDRQNFSRNKDDDPDTPILKYIGVIKEEMIKHLDRSTKARWIFSGYALDFKGTEYERASFVFRKEGFADKVHITYSPEWEIPIFIHKVENGGNAAAFSAIAERVKYSETDDQTGRQYTCTIYRPGKKILEAAEREFRVGR